MPFYYFTVFLYASSASPIIALTTDRVGVVDRGLRLVTNIITGFTEFPVQAK
jgi:hypothetical protein